jgi:hypothetical protein
MMMLLYATDPVFKSMPKFNMPPIRQLFGSLLPAAESCSVNLHLYIDTMTKFQYKLLRFLDATAKAASYRCGCGLHRHHGLVTGCRG